ncbi:MAG: hypothetical protein LPK07_11605 [Hymenobacteraceae bacterium]|nr:hypothetical protein [Hymenobacteraceae bacterium]MDX5482316.1 hypothetical protein [Hymenobacteraceae bacterium]
MKRILLFVLLTIAAIQVNAQHIKELSGFASPESLLQHGRLVYVSNVGRQLQPALKDGDGFISLLSEDGSLLNRHFLPLPSDTLHAPKGMVRIGSTLYVTDIDRIVGFDVKSRKKVFELDMKPASQFLNDLEVLDRNQLTVSATDAGKIFVVNLQGKGSYRELGLTLEIRGANGLKYDASRKQLYVNGFGASGQPTGELYAVRLNRTPTAAKVIPATGYYDGLALSGQTLLLSSWVSFEKAGEILSIDLQTGKSSVLPLPVRFAGPADIWLEAKQQVLWVPAILEGKVYRVNLKDKDQR